MARGSSHWAAFRSRIRSAHDRKQMVWGAPAAQTQDSWEMKGQDPNRKHQAHPKRIPCQTRQLKKALLPTATKSLIELHQGDEFVALRLRQSQLRRKRVGVVCQHLQVIGSPGLEANL
jgi:hypothetical protein